MKVKKFILPISFFVNLIGIGNSSPVERKVEKLSIYFMILCTSVAFLYAKEISTKTSFTEELREFEF